MTQPTTLQIDNVEYVRKDSIKPTIAKVAGSPIGQFCIIRSRDSGVWAGIVAAQEGQNCELLDARRLWTWTAAKGHTLSAVANYGIKEGKLPAAVNTVFLTEVCEYIPTSESVQKNIEDWEEHKA